MAMANNKGKYQGSPELPDLASGESSKRQKLTRRPTNKKVALTRR